MSDERVVREIHGYHTQCGTRVLGGFKDGCGYGAGGWAASPAREGKMPLFTSSEVCHGCGRRFTHTQNVYADIEPVPINGT